MTAIVSGVATQLDDDGVLSRVWLPSRSRPGVRYEMRRFGTHWQHAGDERCEARPRTCWHIKLLEEYMTSEPTTAVAISNGRTSGEMAVRLEDTKQRLAIVQQFFKDVMVKDEDFGVIPGTLKPTLYKPGAEKLCELYGYEIGEPTIVETVNVESGFCRVRAMIPLRRRDGSGVAVGVGEANTMEARYRWREGKRICPKCGAGAIIKGKAEYGGGWVCFKKQSGCGEKFRDNDTAITSQPMGRVENDDPWTLWNTVLKMAKKRALVDATLSATRSSGIFTQDVEDLDEWIAAGDGAAVSAPPKQASRPQSAPASDTAPPPPEPPAHVGRMPSVRECIGIFMRELKDTLAPVDFARVIQDVQAAHPGKFTKEGATILGRLTDAECEPIYADLLRLRPPQDAADARQGELGA